MESTTARVLGAKDGKAGRLGSIGVRFLIDGAETDGGFSLVEHPMPPRALAAPLHRHSREDEYSFVLEGRVGALLGDEVVYGDPGDLTSSHGGSGTPSGMQALSRPVCSRRSPLRVSSGTSGNWSTSFSSLVLPTLRRSPPSLHATGWRSIWRVSLA